MISGPSRGASKDGPSKEGAARALRRLIQLLVLAVLTVVSADVVRPSPAVASVVASVEAHAHAPAHALARASTLPATHQWQAGDVRGVVERGGIYAELEDDDDLARSDLANEAEGTDAAASFPREPGRASPREPQIDAMRFAVGRGLPRAPPV